MDLKDSLAYRYASAVMEGRESFQYKKNKHNAKVGQLMVKSVERFFQDIEKKDFELNVSRGYHPIQFFETLLHHYKGVTAGQKFILEAWQHFYFLNLFGWLNDEGLRRFTRSYLEVARKNGKTSMEAGMGGYHLIGDGESGAECYVGATKEDQAMIAVNDLGQMIRKSPHLKGLFEFKEYHKRVSRVIHKQTLGFMAPLGRDSKNQDGLNPSFGIVDEFHAHKDSSTLDIIANGMVSRQQPTLNIITTAGYNKAYPCYGTTRKTAVDVLTHEDISNDRYFYMIYTMDDGDDYEDPANWIKSNPNLGVSVRKDQIEALFDNALIERGRTWVEFVTKNLNVWMDAPDVWIPNNIVKENNHGITEDDLLGADCYFGVDLASTTDFTSVALLFPDIKGKTVIKVFNWVPRVAVRGRPDGLDLTKWVSDGHVRIAGEETNDYRVQVETIQEEFKKYNIKRGGYDGYLANNGFIVDMLQSSSDPEFLLPVSQYPSTLSEPTRWLEREIRERRIDFMNNPVMEWQLGNVVIQEDNNGNIKPSKGKSENKIDAVMAALDAIAIYLDDIANDKGEPFLFGTI